MKILIVEDDQNKLQKIKEFTQAILPEALISEARSYHSGLKAILADKYSLIALDMTMPSFDRTANEEGGRTRPYAGRDILGQLQERDIAASVVVITQYDVFGDQGQQVTLEALTNGLKRMFPNHFKGAIFFESSSRKWQSELEEILLKAVNGGSWDG